MRNFSLEEILQNTIINFQILKTGVTQKTHIIGVYAFRRMLASWC